MPERSDQPTIQAFIFDLDDTVAHTAPIWRDAEEHLLGMLGGILVAATRPPIQGHERF
jgi:beta-phosphoglucomutase-like phosphatase (HAD superfamily)